MTSQTYISTGNRKPRPHKGPRRRWPLWAVLAVAFGAALVITAGLASAAILLHGRGTLNAPAVQQQDLQVSDVRLSRALLPGGNADLLLSVRNPNAFEARVDQVTLAGPLRKATPTGCTAKVSGPVTKPGGYRLPSADRVLVGAGAKKNVVVHAAFTLAGPAKTGCGFTVEVDVSATQLTSPASPAAVDPTTAPTSIPPAGPLGTTPATTVPATGSTTAAAPPGGGVACDETDPSCVIAPGTGRKIQIPPP